MAAPALALLLATLPAGLLAQDTVRITLPEAVSIAAARNPDVLRAGNSIRSSLVSVQSARGALQPDLSISAGPGVRYQFGGSQNGVDANRASGSFSVGLSSGYTIFNGNANRASISQAEQLARATDISFDRTAQTTVYAVITAFYQIATARELIGVARENLEAERRQLEQVRAFTEAGTRAISDLYTQEASMASAEFSLLDAQRALDVANLGLVQILRLDPMRRYDFLTPTTVDIPEVSAGDTALVTRALAERPEIAAQQARIAAAEQGMRIASAGNSPSVSVSGSFGSSYSTNDPLYGFGPQFFSNNPSASIGLSLSLPLFDRDRTESAEEQAQINYENELLTMATLRQQTSVEVQQAVLELNIAQAQLGVAARQVAAARQALDVEQSRYGTGVSTLTELSLARARYVAAQGQEVQARNTLELRRQAVLFVIGQIEAPRVEPQKPTEQEYRQ